LNIISHVCKYEMLYIVIKRDSVTENVFYAATKE